MSLILRVISLQTITLFYLFNLSISSFILFEIKDVYVFSAHVGIIQKVSRGRRNPPSMGSTVQDWLNYVCATGGDISPTEGTAPASFDKPRSESMSGSVKSPSKDRRSSYTGGFRYEHDTEAIFAIPKFEVEFRSEHDMPMTSIASKWVRKRNRRTISNQL